MTNLTGLILIVDDTPTNLDTISQTLSDAGYDVAIATSGDRALQTVRRRSPDLILLDVMMSGIDGFTTCKLLKADPQSCGIPVIFMTAMVDTDSKIKGFEYGAVDYITKPFQEPEVLARVKTHLQLRYLTQDLEQQVINKTAALQAAKEAAETANRAKSTFLAAITHELRTPLNSVLGMTQGLQEGVFGAISDRQQTAIETIERSGKKLLGLINDLLDLAKIDTAKIELQCQPTSVSLLCKSSLDAVRLSASKKNIHLDLHLPSTLPELIVDERRIRQALTELLHNAIKFTPVGGRVILDISIVSPTSMRLATIDTGIGITPENIPKLFQNFVQIDRDLDRHYEGTGIGLALVKQIVEYHGGKIGLTSELGVGSCFSIDLPATTATSPPSATNPSILTSVITTPSVPAKILLIEADRANIETMTAYLGIRGYQLLVAETGQQAINLAQKDCPDLMMIDMEMTAIDGFEVIRQIREITKCVTLPTIALTASPFADDCQKGVDTEANSYIRKPVNFSQLVATIEKLLKSGVRGQGGEGGRVVGW